MEQLQISDRSMTRLKLTIFLLAILVSCREPYDSPVKVTETKFLVVEGVLNTAGPTSIRLSRTRNLKDTSAVSPELRAQVFIENEGNQTAQLADVGEGEYRLAQLTLPGSRYRLKIRTSNGKEYLSEYVASRNTPAIDSINWKRENGGVQIYVNTHDPLNNTRYYRWEYIETWEFHTLKSKFKYENPTLNFPDGRFLPRVFPQDALPTVCWRSFYSDRILIGSSLNLTQDRIFLYPLAFLTPNSWKLTVRYSILVRQYALTEESFKYWEKMKKNTEQLGSVFDPQPSEITGNIYAVAGDDEPVIGYFDVSSVEEKRLFIDNNEVSGWGDDRDCAIVTGIGGWEYFGIDDVNQLYIPLDIGVISTSARARCVDCRILGTDIKPDFW